MSLKIRARPVLIFVLLVGLLASSLFVTWIILSPSWPRELPEWGSTTSIHGEMSYQDSAAAGFPRYAIASFVVSSKDATKMVELLRSVGAYNVTLIYRGIGSIEAEHDEVLKIYEEFREFGGIIIPEFSFMQTLPPTQRAITARDRFNLFKSIAGEYPSGIFAFQLDTYTLNYLKDNNGIKFALGNVWDQANMDFISNRGAYAFPYYASRRNMLVPARTVEDASVLVMQPFVISLADTYHYDNNHLIDLLTHGGDLEEFKYLSLNYPFFSPFFVELDWLLSLNDQRITRAFIDAYTWMFRNFKVLTPLAFAETFHQYFPTTPEYHVFFKSSSHPAFPDTAGLTIEWLMNPDVRIARLSGRVVSALRYSREPFDTFLSKKQTISFEGPRFGEERANVINLDLNFDVDALWQYEYGNRTLKRAFDVTFDGDLHNFYSSDALAGFLQDGGNKQLQTAELDMYSRTEAED